MKCDKIYDAILVEKARIGSLFAFLLVSAICTAKANELMSSADIMESGRVGLSVYGRHEKFEPTVELSGSSGITLPTPGTGGSQTVFPDSNADVEMEAQFDQQGLALTVRPNEGMHFRAIVGVIQNFQVEFASGSYTNRLDGTSNGFLYGVGGRWNVSPGTMVSPAIAFDLSYIRQQVNLDRFQSNGTVSAAEQRFEQDEFQGAVNVSHRWKNIEPYGGIKIIHSISRLKDKTTKQKITGTSDGWSPFVGLNFEVFPKQSLVVEGSFADEKAFSAGINITF
jgi:hypothetical protein